MYYGVQHYPLWCHSVTFMVPQHHSYGVADLRAALPARGAELDCEHRKAAGEQHESAAVINAPARCVRNDG